jgi:hypothetical protein
MDREAFVHKRKKRYMAQVLDDFEAKVEPHLPEDVAANFKSMIRRKLHALALDSCEAIRLKPGERLNAVGVELRDQLQSEGPTQRRITA